METIKYLYIFSLFFASCLFENVLAAKKVVCYYDHKAALRKDVGREYKVTAEELKPAASMCTHLVYAYVGIDENDYSIKSLDENLDTEKGKNLFRAVTDLKKINPQLKVLLSVGGFEDKSWRDTSHLTKKYLKVLESEKKRGKFASSAVQMIKKYDFDGLDLAWEFPFFKEEKGRGVTGSWWHAFKKAILPATKDNKEKEHRDQFTLLVAELKYALKEENKLLTLTIMPHIKKETYLDVPNIRDNVDQIHLMTLDFRTPQRTDIEADYSAPLQYVFGRNPSQNVAAQVNWWFDKGVSRDKLIVAIPTYGRTWTLNDSSEKSGIPPLKAAGPASDGFHSSMDGIMAYFELCYHVDSSGISLLNDPSVLRKVDNSTGKSGQLDHPGRITYAFRLPKDSEKGIWVSYDDLEVATMKGQFAATYAGGIAVVDLSLDDFRGFCHKGRFPILAAALKGLRTREFGNELR